MNAERNHETTSLRPPRRDGRAFVALLLPLVRALNILKLRWPQAVKLLPACVVDSFGAFWTIQRVVLMVEGG